MAAGQIRNAQQSAHTPPSSSSDQEKSVRSRIWCAVRMPKTKKGESRNPKHASRVPTLQSARDHRSRSKTSGTSQTNNRLNAPNEQPHQKAIAQCIITHIRIATTAPRRAPTSPHTADPFSPAPKCKSPALLARRVVSHCTRVEGHTIRSTCSRHTRKKQPIGLQPNKRGGNKAAILLTSKPQTELWYELSAIRVAILPLLIIPRISWFSQMKSYFVRPREAS